MIKSTLKFTLIAIVVATVMVETSGEAQARRGRGLMLITYGDDIKDVGEIMHRPPARVGTPGYGPNERVGYFCQAVGVLWIFDLWSWSGQWCTYEEDTYYEVSEADAARLLGISPSELSKPFLYSFPLGLICVVGFIGFALVGNVLSKEETGIAEFETVSNEDQRMIQTANQHDLQMNRQATTINPAGSEAGQQFAQPLTGGMDQSFVRRTGNEEYMSHGSHMATTAQPVGSQSMAGVSGIYIMKRDKGFGPMSMEQLSGLIQIGQVTKVDQYWVEGMPEWGLVGTLIDE